MCDCFSVVREELAPEHEVRGYIVLAGDDLIEVASLPLYRKDNGRAENRRGKPRWFIVKYCPFCGEQYEFTKAKTEPVS